MKKSYRLLKYDYKWYCQGTRERASEYALIYAPEDASFANVKSALIDQRHNKHDHIIDFESIEDLTIK